MLTDPAVATRRDTVRPLGSLAPEPAWAAVEEAAQLIAKAEFPLIITSCVGRNPAAIDELARAGARSSRCRWCRARRATSTCRATIPCMWASSRPPFLAKADVIIVLDSVGAVDSGRPRAAARRQDHPHRRAIRWRAGYPFREIEADLLVTGDPRAALAMLRECLGAAVKTAKNGSADGRRKAIATAREEIAARRKKLIETVKDQTPVHPAWLAHCLNQVKSENAIVVSELGVPVSQLDLTQPRSFMGSLLSGGLGFGMGAALGAKLAAPEREVIVTVGDGSYMFGNPVPYHYVGRAENLPTLTIVANNHMWGAVRSATLDVFPDGAAAKANVMPITQLNPSPDFEKVIETCGGRGERVDGPGELLPALERSFAALRSGTPAMLNVMTQGRR